MGTVMSSLARYPTGGPRWSPWNVGSVLPLGPPQSYENYEPISPRQTSLYQTVDPNIQLRIVNFPHEILCEVFLWALVAASDDKRALTAPSRRFLAALDISHVCRRWRYVALRHCHLWRDLPLNMSVLSKSTIAHLWENMLPRFKEPGVRVYLQCISAEWSSLYGSLADKLRLCQALWLIPTIEKLHVKTLAGQASLLDSLLQASTRAVDKLVIYSTGGTHEAPFSPVLVSMLQSERIKQVSLFNVGQLNFPKGLLSRRLIDLYIYDSCHKLSFDQITTAFPSLEALHIDNWLMAKELDRPKISFGQDSALALKSLTVPGFLTSTGFWDIEPWMPNLTSLTISLCPPHDLASHLDLMPSLTHLEVGGRSSQLEVWTQLAILGPKLTSISGRATDLIRVLLDWECIPGLESEPFPKLDRLVLDYGYDRVNHTDLAQLIRLRVAELPQRVMSPTAETYSQLSIVKLDKISDPLATRKALFASPLLRGARWTQTKLSLTIALPIG